MAEVVRQYEELTRQAIFAAASLSLPPRTDADVMTRDWHHEYYPNLYLPDASYRVIWWEFTKMVGPPLSSGVIRSAEQVVGLRRQVADYNQTQALIAAGTPAPTWPGAKLVLWRGCWAILSRQKRNKRQCSGQLNVKLDPDARP